MIPFDDIQAFLAARRIAPGETVQFGWLVFRIAEVGPPIRLESLDFKNMASWTEDLSRAEEVHAQQSAALKTRGVAEEPCTLLQSAVTSKSYSPGHPAAFMSRSQPTSPNDSGWYIGTLDDQLDLANPESLELKSLYELSISDPRLTPYWLMPFESCIRASDGAFL